MSDTNTQNLVQDDDALLQYAREQRLGFHKAMIDAGEGRLPTDKDGFTVWSKNLEQLERGAQQSKQLKQDERSSDQLAAIARESANQIALKMGGIAMFMGNPDPNREPPAPVSFLGTTTPAPGELTTGDDTRSFDEFDKEVGAQIRQRRSEQSVD